MPIRSNQMSGISQKKSIMYVYKRLSVDRWVTSINSNMIWMFSSGLHENEVRSDPQLLDTPGVPGGIVT